MSEAQRFRPFKTTDAEYAALLTFQDGVPPELREPFLAWLMNQIVVPWQMMSGGHLNEGMAHEIRALSGIDLGQVASATIDDTAILDRLKSFSLDVLLRLADVVLLLSEPAACLRLMTLFEMTTSKWAVGPIEGHFRLVERVPEGVQDSIDVSTKSGSTAGTLLLRAFTSAYGLSPNPGEAYKMSVKAVETAARQ